MIILRDTRGHSCEEIKWLKSVIFNLFCKDFVCFRNTHMPSLCACRSTCIFLSDLYCLCEWFKICRKAAENSIACSNTLISLSPSMQVYPRPQKSDKFAPKIVFFDQMEPRVSSC